MTGHDLSDGTRRGDRRRRGSRWPRRLLIGLALLAVVPPCLVLLLLVSIDRGLLDAPIQRLASARLGRSVRFAGVSAHLLSPEPTITIRGLTVANPPWTHGGTLAEARSASILIEPLPLLYGVVHPREIRIDHPVLHLVRLGPGRNNWTFSNHPGSGPAFAPLRSVTRFVLTDGWLDFLDYGRGAHFLGRFAHDDRAPVPFRVAGSAMLRGFPITMTAQGGAINGAAVGPPYPFAARIVDAKTVVLVRGHSGDPFDLTRYDLAFRSAGPNLADLGYLFNLLTPNSAPFRLTARARSDGRYLSFSDMSGRVGASDATGAIWSDHGSARRQLHAKLRAGRFDKGDLDALLAIVPPRATARVKSGAVLPGHFDGWLLSDASFGVARLREADVDFDLGARTVTGYPVPLADVATRVTLYRGRLDVPRFAARLYAGTLRARARLDASAALPRLKVAGVLDGARLADIGPHPSPRVRGRLHLAVDLAGTGDSIHAAAATSSGSAHISVTGAAIPRQAGWMLGGDLLRAATASAGGGGDVAVDCASASFAGSRGRLLVRDLAIATAMGSARGTGFVDLGTERLSLTLDGAPLRHRAFQVAAPVLIAGPWLRPAVSVLPGRNARKLGLRGMLGVALTPLAGLLPLGRSAVPPARCR